MVVRSSNFNFNKTMPQHYYANNSLLTHLLNSFHIIFPYGERFFVRSVQYFAKDIKNTKLKNAIKYFIAQEVQHGKAHEGIRETLAEQGLKPYQFEKFYAETSFKYFETPCTWLFGPVFSLSTTAALEHLTAILADAVLNNTEILAGLPDEIREMIIWHASEEIEHKDITFDMLKEINPDYRLRIGGLLIGSFSLWTYIILGQIHFIKNDSDFRWQNLLTDIPQMFKLLKKPMKKIMADFFDYLRPDFHPNDKDNKYLIKEFLKNNSKRFVVLRKAS